MKLSITISTTLVTILALIAAYCNNPAPYSPRAAEKDISEGIIKQYGYGLSITKMRGAPVDQIDAVYAKYGFKEESAGCLVTEEDIQQMEEYNAVVEEYLDKRNGFGWRRKFTNELFLALRVKHLDTIKTSCGDSILTRTPK
jgi:hypothetical protein